MHKIVATGSHSNLQNIDDKTSGTVKVVGRSRRSLVFFTGPTHESLIVPVLDSSIVKNHLDKTSSKASVDYKPIKSGEHLFMKLNRTNGYLNNI